MDTKTEHVGNWLVSVTGYNFVDGWTRKILDTPSFIMGGVAGQAMTRNDVVANLRIMWPDMDGSAVDVNGSRVSNPKRGNRRQYFINVYAADVAVV